MEAAGAGGILAVGGVAVILAGMLSAGLRSTKTKTNASRRRCPAAGPPVGPW
jgi:hypothetical protein